MRSELTKLAVRHHGNIRAGIDLETRRLVAHVDRSVPWGHTSVDGAQEQTLLPGISFVDLTLNLRAVVRSARTLATNGREVSILAAVSTGLATGRTLLTVTMWLLATVSA